MPKNMTLALKLGIQTYQILTNDDEVCIPSLSSILLAVAMMDIPNLSNFALTFYFLHIKQTRNFLFWTKIRPLWIILCRYRE